PRSQAGRGQLSRGPNRDRPAGDVDPGRAAPGGGAVLRPAPQGARRGRLQSVISVVIPVYNERESLPTLFAEIQTVARNANLDLEVVFVDDGSKDGSWDVISDL